MAQARPPLFMIAQPKATYRERYMCEGDRRRNRAQRFVHADGNAHNFVYPTVGIPNEWMNALQTAFYIRLTLVTIPNGRAPVRCVHPYPIKTEDTNVINDPSTNSLYFPVSNDELLGGRKSFQFTLLKLTQYQLKNHGPLKILNCRGEIDDQRLEDLTDAKKTIEIYQLGQAQLLFSIATFGDNTQIPVIYDISSVYSHRMTGTTTSTNDDDDISFRCSPQRGDWRGGDEILMVIPKIDKRKAFAVRFVHPLIDERSTVALEFVDAKTISFYTPPCPVILTKDAPTVSIPIVVTQSDIAIARVDFIYQSLDNCLNCNPNLMLTSSISPTSNKRSFQDFDEDEGVEFYNLTLNRTEKKEEIDHSHMRNSINTARISSAIRSDDKFPLLEDAIRRGHIDAALTLIEETNSFLERENNQGETPLLLAAESNQNRLIITILEKRSELIIQTDKHGNNLLHILASVSGDEAKTTIENVLKKLDSKTKKCLLRKLNNDQQTPKEVAQNHGNMQCIDLLE